jgi:hypothetical protein
VLGIGNGMFAPQADITRQDLAAILARYAEAADKQFHVTLQYKAFEDDASIAGYAKGAVQTLFCGSILQGKPGNRFDPEGASTRAEVAAVIRRFAEATAG